MIALSYLGSAAITVVLTAVFVADTGGLRLFMAAIGGITGPLLFGQLIESGERGQVAVAFLIGAAVMVIGGLVELAWGVKAEGRQLEDIAPPLTTADEDRS